MSEDKDNEIYDKYIKLKKENKLLNYKINKYKEIEQKPLNIHSFILDKIGVKFESYHKLIIAKDIKKIKIVPTMEISNNIRLMGCLLIWYGIKVYGYDDFNEEIELIKIPIEEISDSCDTYNNLVMKRLNIFNLTIAIAQFIKSEIERSLKYEKGTSQVEIEIVEEKKTKLLELSKEEQ